jgi:hypothetical protein
VSGLPTLDVELAVALAGAASFGIAGNFAGHLEQAGEAGDFVALASAPDRPKGVFPTWIAGAPAPLGFFPFSDSTATWPLGADPAVDRVQIEPELALILDVTYDAAGRVVGLRPTHAAAYDDGSIRREGARKISDKKNWGVASKGLSSTWLVLPPDSAVWDALAPLTISCVLQRGGERHEYGITSPCGGYTLWGPPLLEWLVERFRTQVDEGPLEDLAGHLDTAGRPQRIVVGVGATRYTAFGESHFLRPGDVAEVRVGPLLLRRQVG